MPNDERRVSIISYDFRQHKGSSQARKTRFFRELYGYTQQVKRQLKSGDVIVRTYHYPGILDQVDYTKLGKSVLAVDPGTEESIIKLFRAFDEVEFYNFIGWLPNSIWPSRKEIDTISVSELIAVYGYLSILVQMRTYGKEEVTYSDLLDEGFDSNYISQAVQYLSKRNLLITTKDTLRFTSKAQQLLEKVE
jgi:hypothetical protein